MSLSRFKKRQDKEQFPISISQASFQKTEHAPQSLISDDWIINNTSLSNETLYQMSQYLHVNNLKLDAQKDAWKTEIDPFEAIQSDLDCVKQDNMGINQTLDNHEARLLEIEKKMTESKEEMVFETIDIRELSYEDAKREIIEYYKQHTERVYVSDILRDLHIDPELTMKIMDDLEKEGVIGEKEK